MKGTLVIIFFLSIILLNASISDAEIVPIIGFANRDVVATYDAPENSCSTDYCYYQGKCYVYNEVVMTQEYGSIMCESSSWEYATNSMGFSFENDGTENLEFFWKCDSQSDEIYWDSEREKTYPSLLCKDFAWQPYVTGGVGTISYIYDLNEDGTIEKGWPSFGFCRKISTYYSGDELLGSEDIKTADIGSYKTGGLTSLGMTFVGVGYDDKKTFSEDFRKIIKDMDFMVPFKKNLEYYAVYYFNPTPRKLPWVDWIFQGSEDTERNLIFGSQALLANLCPDSEIPSVLVKDSGRRSLNFGWFFLVYINGDNLETTVRHEIAHSKEFEVMDEYTEVDFDTARQLPTKYVPNCDIYTYDERTSCPKWHYMIGNDAEFIVDINGNKVLDETGCFKGCFLNKENARPSKFSMMGPNEDPELNENPPEEKDRRYNLPTACKICHELEEYSKDCTDEDDDADCDSEDKKKIYFCDGIHDFCQEFLFNIGEADKPGEEQTHGGSESKKR